MNEFICCSGQFRDSRPGGRPENYSGKENYGTPGEQETEGFMIRFHLSLGRKGIHDPCEQQRDQNQGSKEFPEIEPLFFWCFFCDQSDYGRCQQSKCDHQEKVTAHLLFSPQDNIIRIENHKEIEQSCYPRKGIAVFKSNGFDIPFTKLKSGRKVVKW